MPIDTQLHFAKLGWTPSFFYSAAHWADESLRHSIGNGRPVNKGRKIGSVTRTFGLRAALTFLVLIATAPAFIVVVQSSLGEQEGRLVRAEAGLRSVVDLGAAHQESLVEGARQMLAAIAYSPPVYGEDEAACADYMKKLQAHYPAAYGSFGVLDTSGRLTCRAVRPASSVNSSDREFFKRAVRTGRFSVGEYTVSRASGKPVLTFGLPVFREDGTTLRGVTYLAVDISQADERLRLLTLTPETSLLVADANGLVLAAAGARKAAVGEVVPEPFLVAAMAKGEPRYERATGADGKQWLFAMRPVGRAGERKLFVAGMASTEELLAPLASSLLRQLAALTLITLVAAGAAWVFGDRVLARPVRRLLERVDALADDEAPLPEPAGQPRALRELGQLDTRLSEVARRLAERAVQRDGALAEMAHQRHLLESVFEGMAEGVFVVDPKGRVLHVNAAAQRILPGLASSARTQFLQADSRKLGIFLMDGATTCEAPQRPVARALAGENVEGFRHVLRGALTGGEEKVVQGSARPMLGAQGQRSGAVVVFSDVTQAWRAENELRESEARYRQLFESNPHPMWVFDRDSLRFLTVNDAAVAHYGYSREEFLAMTIADIRPDEDVLRLHDTLDVIDSVSAPRAWRHKLKDGTLIWVEISSHAMDFEGRPARLVLAHDVTQLITAQQALVDANDSLERRVEERTRALHVANAELESFAYSVSHDLRAPLAAIDGFSRALQTRHAEHLDKQGQHFLHRIRENTRSMGDLIDDLLSLARVTRAEIRAEDVNLADKAAQIVERLRQRDPQREVSVEIDEDIACTCDSRLLSIVLENLIENAWKFTARTPTACIQVGSRVEAGQKVFFVADNGAGFDMAYADKLFHAFQRLHAVTDFAGTGIGLATVHRIVTRHGGRVWANSTPGQGAIFQFTLSAGTTDEKQPDTTGRGQPGSPGTHPDDAGREQCPQ